MLSSSRAHFLTRDCCSLPKRVMDHQYIHRINASSHCHCPNCPHNTAVINPHADITWVLGRSSWAFIYNQWRNSTLLTAIVLYVFIAVCPLRVWSYCAWLLMCQWLKSRIAARRRRCWKVGRLRRRNLICFVLRPALVLYITTMYYSLVIGSMMIVWQSGCLCSHCRWQASKPLT